MFIYIQTHKLKAMKMHLLKSICMIIFQTNCLVPCPVKNHDSYPSPTTKTGFTHFLKELQ
jgi:hypothetical protein